MADHRNRRRLAKRHIRNGCSGKKRYVDWGKAVIAAAQLLDRHRLNKCSVYLCHRGNHYHVSKSTGGTGYHWLIEREGVAA